MKFHLFMSSSKHILFLLERSWLFFVCDKVRHRKWLGGISSIFRMHLKHLDNLSPSQRSLLHFQSCGEQFTNDAKKYFGDVSATCPYCGRADDSRMHRFEHCEYFQPIRSEFPSLMRDWHTLPLQAKAYSLWPEPPLFEQFLGLMHCVPFPRISKDVSIDHHVVFTDGSCKHQKFPEIRLSSAAAIEALPNGDSSLIWSGIVPGQQSIYRGEILAGITAIMRYQSVTIYTDNLAFLKTARTILRNHREGKIMFAPEEERDLWTLLMLSLDANSCIYIKKTKAHTAWQRSSCPQVKWQGYFNDLADQAAKSTITCFEKSFPWYIELCKQFFSQLHKAKQLALFHARIGEHASDFSSETPNQRHVGCIGDVCGQITFVQSEVSDIEIKPNWSSRFVDILLEWLSSLEWYSHTSDGYDDISWTELFGLYLLTTKTFPPISMKNLGDRLQSEHEDVITRCCTFNSGLKTWRRYLGYIMRVYPDILPPRVNISRSITRWNRKGAGIHGRVAIADEQRADLHQWLNLSGRRLPWPFFE